MFGGMYGYSNARSHYRVSVQGEYKDCSSVNIFAAFDNLLTEKRGF